MAKNTTPSSDAPSADTADYFNSLAAELADDPKALEKRFADQVAAMVGAPTPAAGGAA